jgi:L-2-hydroxyglutarate oxidase
MRIAADDDGGRARTVTTVAGVSAPTVDSAPQRCDLAVVGGGILGLAVARELTRRLPHASVCVLERDGELARHQTGHNSGVIHAGIYYEPGSLKAQLCVRGAREMYEYCAQREIPHERCGKVIVATDPSELERLEELERRGRANEVAGLRRLDADGIRELEPHATGIAGLHSPATGIADFAAVARAYAQDARAAGAAVVTGCEVRGVHAGARQIRLEHSRGATEAGHAIFCAGAWADRLAVAAGADPDPRIVPFRGAYLRLERPELVRGQIYPVPDPALPFLGVHLSRTVGGDVLVGPTALLAPTYVDLRATLRWPGTWRVMRRWWRTGVTEIAHAASRRLLMREARRFVPEVGGVMPGPRGYRAQAVGRDGALVDDFLVVRTGRAVHVLNAPSPAATASLAIAEMIAEEVSRR